MIVPIFALANSGIQISIEGLRNAAGSAITWGVLLGLVLGKPLGIVIATSATIRAGFADNPEGTAPLQIVGVGTTAGIGFTVALFITELALIDPVEQSNAKLAILAGSVLAAAISTFILRRTTTKEIRALR